MLTPDASRPETPAEYGIAPADGGKGLLPWSWAEERLAGKHIWWLATSRADGRPHLMPIWAIWFGDGVAFSTGGTTLKARNIARDPRVSIIPERGPPSVIVEGVAEPLEPARVDAIYAEYLKVWDTDVSTMDSPIFLIRPTKVFGFIDEEGEFPNNATRWTFA